MRSTILTVSCLALLTFVALSTPGQMPTPKARPGVEHTLTISPAIGFPMVILKPGPTGPGLQG